MTPRLLVSDKDIRMAIFFMSNLSTVLHYMQCKVAKQSHDKRVYDIAFYSKKISMYEIVFESLVEEFIEDMFGPYANSISREAFQVSLAINGWKFFEKKKP